MTDQTHTRYAFDDADTTAEESLAHLLFAHTADTDGTDEVDFSMAKIAVALRTDTQEAARLVGLLIDKDLITRVGDAPADDDTTATYRLLTPVNSV